MASASNLNYLTEAIDAKITAIKTRLEVVTPGSEQSDRAAQLLRELSSALTDFDTRSVDIYNRSL